jgi:lysophospholipase L1-like esterase|tara:strand:+ start:2066 stop:3007 length:942 start_codon:yes stop_codon:yes gene_type:complete
MAVTFVSALAIPAVAAPVGFGLGDSITFGETDLQYIPSFGDRGYVGRYADIVDSRNGDEARPLVVNTAIDGETAESFFDGTGRTPPVVGRTDIPLASQNLNYETDPTTPQAVKFQSLLSEQRAAGNEAAFVTLTLGFNELAALTILPEDEALAQIDPTLAAYRANYIDVVSLVRASAPEADLYLLNYFNPFPADPTENTADAVFGIAGPRLNDIIREVAENFGATYVDVASAFAGREAELTFIDEFPAGSTVPTPHPFGPGTAPIGNVHPNADGYQVIADQIAAAEEVPEPAMLGLMAFGLLGISLVRYRNIS